MRISRTDRRLLDELQRDVTQSQHELADKVGMSRTSCWRRIREFEQDGIIEKQVALLNPRKLGFQIHVLLSVAMVEHTDANRDSFEGHVQSLPEVTECYSVSGDRDYVLQVVVRDMMALSLSFDHRLVDGAPAARFLQRVRQLVERPFALAFGAE